MKQVLVRQGAIVVEEVPAPALEPGTVLVAVRASCLSPGTELAGLRADQTPLWRKALRRPKRVARVLKLAAREGFARARAEVEGVVDGGRPTGYAAAGVVLEVAADVEGLRPGDAVACAGAQFAHHAEVIRVPVNLCARVPDGLDLVRASTATLGAIALQGVRRLAPTLGETFVVVGLGLLGQLTVQLLRANGCRTIGVDLDRRRIALALELGLDVGLHPDDGDEVAQVGRLTAGVGADGAVVTAATPSDAPLSAAFRMCRRKGRVVLVGDVGLNIARADIYAKELDFLVSCSYGPGRYDRRFEEEGYDYPEAYVRWTETRNLEEYLRLVAAGRLEVGRLIERTLPIERAAEAYEALASASPRPLVAVLEYPAREGPGPRVVPNAAARPAGRDRPRLAIIGPGGFVRGVHLPNLRASGEWALRTIVARTGHGAASVARQWGAERSATDVDAAFSDPDVDAVLIGTRHDTHADLTLRALRAGKHVLVEKPLALTAEEVAALRAFYADGAGAKPVLLTGFNRRFSPHAARVKALLAGRTGPATLAYRMNAGPLPREHWVHSPQGGGRNRGEACHVYDLLRFLAGRRVTGVSARPVLSGALPSNDSFAALLSFDDGSLGSLVYASQGSSELGKELLEVFSDGRVLRLDDYRSVTVHGAKSTGLTTPEVEKGHREELAAFTRCVRHGGPWPISLEEQLEVTEVALEVERQLSGAVAG